MQKVDGRAIVIGAGIAGLVTARVLSRRHASVTVLDRDKVTGSEPRRGVPQGTQPHLLLVSGVRALEELFPGLEDELAGSGAVRFDSGLGLCAYRYGMRWPAAPTGLDLVTFSRPHLEGVLRDRVTAIGGVTLRDDVAVTRLDGADGRVTGVVLDTGETLPADLVVDCSGRGARSDRWLAALDFPAPEQVEVKIGVTYTTRVYRRSPGQLDGWQAAAILPTPPGQTRNGLVVPIEGDRWQVAVGGWHVETPPTDPETFTEYARSLPDPLVAELIADAEPLSDPVLFRFPSSRRRLFEKLDRLPAGYVALGDAICSFNPIYGQGMTCAAMEAVALGRTLDRHRDATADMARDYYRAAARVLDTPWRFAVGGDFSFPGTTGPRPSGGAVVSWYARRLALASQMSPAINATFFRVQHLVAPPRALFSPGLILRVLWFSRQRIKTGPPIP